MNFSDKPFWRDLGWFGVGLAVVAILAAIGLFTVLRWAAQALGAWS